MTLSAQLDCVHLARSYSAPPEMPEGARPSKAVKMPKFSAFHVIRRRVAATTELSRDGHFVQKRCAGRTRREIRVLARIAHGGALCGGTPYDRAALFIPTRNERRDIRNLVD